ncbi:MAG: bifunctional riboflavin kinase/FAD synthetase [Flavicella sp.]
MKVIKNYNNFSVSKKSIVTIGTFDGVHLGHQKILEKLVATAKKEKYNSVLLTFFPHPRMVLQKDASIKLIHSIEERIAMLEKTGLDYLIIHPFDAAFSRLTALEFVRSILVEKLETAELVIGYDHRFGKNREGNFEQLEEYGHMYDFKVNEISALDIDAISVSSTKIRKALLSGDVKKANAYLGNSFFLTGTIVKGDRIGNTIGFPTANLEIAESYKLIPQNGVYLVRSQIKGVWKYGMMNIGYRPTVKGENRTLETHFFDFNSDLYGQKIQVELLDFIRKEQKFDSLEQLKKQLFEDKERSMVLMKNI